MTQPGRAGLTSCGPELRALNYYAVRPEHFTALKIAGGILLWKGPGRSQIASLLILDLYFYSTGLSITSMPTIFSYFLDVSGLVCLAWVSWRGFGGLTTPTTPGWLGRFSFLSSRSGLRWWGVG